MTLPTFLYLADVEAQTWSDWLQCYT